MVREGVSNLAPEWPLSCLDVSGDHQDLNWLFQVSLIGDQSKPYW